MEQENKYKPVHAGEIIMKKGGLDYVQVPAGEPFEAHISKIEQVESRVYETTTNEMETKLAVSFQLDAEIDGQGQVYTNWIKPSLHAKSKMTPLILALYNGKVPDELDADDMVGRPLRMVLTEGVEKNGKNRQYVASYLKPTAAQKRVESPVAIDESLMDDLDAAFDAAIEEAK